MAREWYHDQQNCKYKRGDGGDVSDFQLHNFEMIAETKSENKIYIQLHCTCKLSNFITKKLNPPSFFEIITYELVVM